MKIVYSTSISALDFNHDGALELVTVRKIGAQSTFADAGTTASNGATFVRISEALDESGQLSRPSGQSSSESLSLPAHLLTLLDHLPSPYKHDV